MQVSRSEQDPANTIINRFEKKNEESNEPFKPEKIEEKLKELSALINCTNTLLSDPDSFPNLRIYKNIEELVIIKNQIKKFFSVSTKPYIFKVIDTITYRRKKNDIKNISTLWEKKRALVYEKKCEEIGELINHTHALINSENLNAIEFHFPNQQIQKKFEEVVAIKEQIKELVQFSKMPYFSKVLETILYKQQKNQIKEISSLWKNKWCFVMASSAEAFEEEKVIQDFFQIIDVIFASNV